MEERIYTSDGLRFGGWRAWKEMVRELAGSSELIWRLILRDVSVRYRQSMLGYAWAVIPAVVTVGISAFLTGSRVVSIGATAIPYVAYALWGISLWQLFSGCLTACTNSLAHSGSLVTKIHFTKEALVIAALGQPLFDFFIRLVPVAVAFLWYGVALPWTVVFMPVLLVPVVLLALGLGFIFSIANVAIRDVGNALGVVLTLGMFLTPVLYPPPVRWPFSLVNVLNPFSPLLIASQDLIAYGSLTRPDTFGFSCLFSLLIFLGGWRFFRLTISRIAEYA